ncbi:flagellar filament capping protein FliD [Rhizorhapis suberifaciens]|uniref:Flagellar hook-associated protein 2 n=1 Tax=Rhizorhapis suberifaciens TaxID=13656 RepID=A0A840HX01_9SPHN|nr:flagellar filament capping protein FliD [Rhizorhapis suberifaciens]MBB4642483.1 flagellar hook-associated protein 2 [Rhizorhapis suberifaciens]
MVTSVSSGITSALGLGYGIDSASIVSGLVSAVRGPKEQVLSARESLVSAQISALANASGALDTFSKALSELLADSSYSGNPASSDSSIAAVKLTQEGDLSNLPIALEVKALATSQVLKSTTLANSGTAVGIGTLTLATSSGSYAITIDSNNNTLAGLATAINDADAGVTATVVTDSSGARLVLKGGVGGSEAFTLSDSGDADADLQRFTSTGGLTQVRPAQNATIVLDGVETSFASNTIVDAIPNVTIDLMKAIPGSTITISEEQPTKSMRGLVGEFVDAYNGLWKSLSALTVAGTSETKGGILASDYSIRQMKGMLSKLTSTPLAASGTFTTLAQIGVQTTKEGTLKIDAAALDKALDDNAAAVTAMINPFTQDASNPGLAGALEAIKTRLQNVDPNDERNSGMLVAAKKRYEAVREKIEAEQERFEESMANYEERLSATFSAMDTKLATLKASQNYLEQQIKMWNSSDD